MKAHPEKQFLFRLARELGMTVSRLRDEMDARELSEWIAFFSLENEELQKKQQKPQPKGDLGERLKASLGAWNLGSKSRKPAH